MRRALALHDLIITTTRVAFVVLQIPLLQTTPGDILPEEHVECGIDALEHVISDEDNGIESVENHASFCSRIPAVMASSRKKCGIEAMAATST